MQSFCPHLLMHVFSSNSEQMVHSRVGGGERQLCADPLCRRHRTMASAQINQRLHRSWVSLVIVPIRLYLHEFAFRFGYLFNSQVIPFSSTHRKACYTMIADAISAVIKNTMAQEKQNERAKETNETKERNVHSTNLDVDAAEAQLRQLVKSNYGSAIKWFEEIKGKSGSISRTDWKTATKQIGLAVNNEIRKAIRKRVARDGSKLINLSQLSSFIDPVDSASDSTSDSTSDSASELCAIPLEVPSLPDNFHPRGGPLEALVASLVKQQTTTVSSITAPKARNAISSQV